MDEQSITPDLPVPVFPVCATVWPSDGRGEWEMVDDLTGEAGLERLRSATEEGATVWIETRVEVEDSDQCEWLEGEFKVWEHLPMPRIFWRKAGDTLRAVSLKAPAPSRENREPATCWLLRALPYTYSRGIFGTVRDVFSEAWVVDELDRRAGSDPLTIFPTAGFKPSGEPSEPGVEYAVLHAALGVIGNTIVSVRLPDTFCPSHGDRYKPRKGHSPRKLVPADVLARFLPRDRTASGREVAEAIGMHQATSARAVAAQIRKRLENIEKEGSTSEGNREQDEAQKELKGRLENAATEVDELAEIAQQLDGDLSTVLRRFSGEISNAPDAAQELVPPETRRRYRYALDNVHALHDDCRLTAQVVRHEVAAFEQSQREHFQLIAAVLASVFLIPTVIASVFGVNLGIPGEHSKLGFLAFVTAMGALALVGYSALRTAGEHHWSPPPGALNGQIAAGVAIVLALVVALLLVS